MNTHAFTIHTRAMLAWGFGLWLSGGTVVHGSDIDPMLVGSWPAFPQETASAVSVSGNYAYVAVTAGFATPLGQRFDLQVIDVSDVRNPRWVGGCDLGGPARRLVVLGNYVYAADSSAFQVIDISDRIHPRRVGGCESGGSPWGLAISGNHAYVALRSGGLQLIDNSEPANPQPAGRFAAAGGSVNDVAVSGSYAYVAGWWQETNRVKQGLQVVDVSIPTTPKRVASLVTSSEGAAVAVSGNHGYLADAHGGLQVIDITNPLQPESIGSYEGPGLYSLTKTVVVSGDRVYLAETTYDPSSGYSPAGFKVIDVSNPGSPQRLGAYATPWSWQEAVYLDVAILGQHVFVAGAPAPGLDVVDVSKPADPQWVSGYSGTGARAVALSGDYACVAYNTRGLQVIDISAPAHPVSVGGCDTDGLALGVTVAGRYAYVADGRLQVAATQLTGGLNIIDISNPAHPVRVSRHEAGGDARDVVVAGQYAYVAGGAWSEGTNQHPGGLWIVDVSDPVSPLLVANHVTSGNARAVAVSGSYAYLALEGVYDGTNNIGAGLEVIDISNPPNPQRKGVYEMQGSALGVALAGNYAYVAAGGFSDGSKSVGGGLQIIDVSNPPNPQWVAECEPDSSARGVTVSGSYACLAGSWVTPAGTYAGGLQVIDVSKSASPQLLGRYRTGGPMMGLVVSGRFAYLGEGSSVKVVDLSRPANPQQLSICDTPAGAVDVVVAGNYAFVADGDWLDGTNWHSGGLQVIDISVPAHPQRVGGCDSGRALAVAFTGTYAYVADGGSWDGTNYVGAGLQVIDISNPISPKRVGSCMTGNGGSVWDVAVSGSNAYLSGGHWDESALIQRDSLVVIDVSSPSNPRRVGGFDSTGFGMAVALSGAYAYLAGDVAGLQVLDVSTSENPRQVGGYAALKAARSVAVSGNYAYVVDGSAGLQVINISNPANPRWVGEYVEGSGTSWYGSGVVVFGAYAYVGRDSAGIELLDVSNPAKPQRVGGNSVFSAANLAVSQGRVFVAAGTDGLGILELQPFFKSISNESLNLRLHWEGFGLARMQRATRLGDPDWQELPGYEGTNTASLPFTSGPEFFRLVRP